MHVSPFHPLPRPRIAAALAAAMSNHTFVVVSAPMGFGKTTAAQELAKVLGEQALFLTAPRDAVETRQFIESSRTWANPSFVILDDYRHINDPTLDEFLDKLARGRPAGFRIALFSRVRPGLPLGELFLKGRVALFGWELFAFTQAEAWEFFRMHGFSDREDADEAWRYSEGWPAGLRLCLRHRMAHGTGNPVAEAERLLGETVYAPCSPAEKSLLMQLSVLDAFTAEEAFRLTRTPRVRRLLRELHDKNAFVEDIPSDDSYRIHGIFRSFLAKALEASDFARPALYRRAGECMIARGELLPAIRLLRRAGRDGDLLRVLDVLSQDNSKRLPRLFPGEAKAESMPWRLRLKRPMEYLSHIYFRLVECGDPLAAMLLNEAEERFNKAKCIPEAMKKRLAGETLLIRSMLASNDLDTVLALQEKAHRLLHGRSTIASRHMLWTFGCPHAAYLYLRKPGTYRRLISAAEGGLQYIHALADGCFVGAKPLLRAEWLLERAEFGEVNGLLAAARSRAASKGQTTSLLLADFIMARRLAATGDAATAGDGLGKWIPEIQAMGDTALSDCLDFALAYIYSLLGRCGEIPRWLCEGEADPSRHGERIVGFVHVVRGKAALTAGDYGRADAIAKMLPASLGPCDNLFGHIHAKALEAAAAARLRSEETARRLLRDALALAKPDGIVLTLAEYGAELLTILRAMPEAESGDAYFQKLVTHSERFARLSAKGRRGLSGTHGLTPREREMLCLVVKGHSNQAIARRLGIAEGTVKKALISAYGKLQAKNRAVAVRKFLEAGGKR